MTINLPEDLQRFIQAEVHSGHFTSADAVIAEAVRLFRQQLSQAANTATAARQPAANAADPVLGALRDAADEMDEIVADAMNHREQPWRLSLGE